DNFTLAEKLYLKAASEQVVYSTLFYNLGNAYYRQGNLGKAIVNYERALKLDPSNADARTNLEFVKGQITDKEPDSSSVVGKSIDRIISAFHADAWAWIALALFAVFIGAAAAYLFSEAVFVRKTAFFGGLVVFVLTVCAVAVSFAAADNYAIILPPASQLSTSPREARSQSEQAFLLHEGTKVEVIDSVSSPGEGGKWLEVRVPTGERAWIKSSDVERI
ncbi:MAG: tetratricopeptide repeat protein, partial [Muribaculaceae bacterium]|nr:tetratricopeptide repeat protein [Muribaculaceae bacterium]